MFVTSSPVDVECAVVDGHVGVESTSDATSSREDILLESFSLHTLHLQMRLCICKVFHPRKRICAYFLPLALFYDQKFLVPHYAIITISNLHTWGRMAAVPDLDVRSPAFAAMELVKGPRAATRNPFSVSSSPILDAAKRGEFPAFTLPFRRH